MENTEIAVDDTSTKSNRNAKIMAGLYAIAVFLFCFVGLVALLIAASGRERDGVLAAKILAGPASFAIAGFVGSLLSIFFLKGKDVLQIAVPVVLSMIGGFFGFVFIFVFFNVIWRML